MLAARLKRPLAIAAVAAVLAAAVAGCANASSGAAGSFTPRTANTLTVATAQIPDPGFWEGTFAHPTGGFEYRLAQKLAARFGLNKLKVVEVPFHELVRGRLGGADLALSDITITDERAEHLDFSSSYLKAPPSILVRPGTEVSDVKAARALHWAVQHDTTLKTALERSIEPTTQTLVFEHQREVLLALHVGRASAVMLDLPVALAYARDSPRSYAVAGQLPSEAQLGVALPQGSHNVEAIDSAIRGLKAEGEIDRLGHEWLHADLQEGRAEDVPVLRAEE
ncbi:MAG TPA: ABC transporter substrate-binding protein [Solirubrobacteraceae bacterium]|jgi:polar amino acid transport system substrate-binding protein|nr:ABC transporter substrate-binding protein [Solirubrobacteraceae bacterium]